jgi:glycosyltransferase involved in cell wall biosynthesis
VAHYMRDYLIREFGLEPQKVAAITRGIPVGELEFSGERRFTNQDLVILSTRGYWWYSNYEEILKAAAILKHEYPDFRFTLVGDGNERARAQALSSKLGLESYVTIKGHVSQDEVFRLMRQSDLYVSLTRTEGCSNSLLEGMAMGLYPLVSDLPANREWITDGKNGALMALGDPEGLARQIKEVAEDVELRRHAAQVNRKIVEQRANLAKNIQAFIQFFEEVQGSWNT